MINWILQVVAVTAFNIRTIPQRGGASIAAIVGIAGVVGVLVSVLSIAAGFRAAMSTGGPDDVVIVMRSGSDNEMTSNFSRDEVQLIKDAPGVARTSEGPLASAELFAMINLPKISTGTDANVPLRGVQRAAGPVRDGLTIVEGRDIQSGMNEVVVGAGAARAFAGLDVGSTVRVGRHEWTVVGIFTGGGGSSESEIWTDAPVLQSAYQRGETFQSVYVKLRDPEAFPEFKDALTADPRLKVKAVRQRAYLAEQSTMLSGFIETIGYGVAFLMAVGALFGALNTMYSAVAGRTREIATLRALGFGATPIVLSVLAESLVLAVIGGVLGGGLAYVVFNGFQATTMNWQTFSQVAFAFAVTPALLVTAIIWAAVIGLFGGFFPAIRAARLPIASALREG